jgi:uncharacterized protein (TIGR01777 family)
VNVLLVGGTGFIGSALTQHLRWRGHRVSLLSRRPSSRTDPTPVFHWDPERAEFDRGSLDGITAVVNLAGENLAGGRWTPELKRRLALSRVASTQFLVKQMREGTAPPSVLVSVSGVGIYGNRGDEVLTEASTPGTGFLAELCLAWEDVAFSASAEGTRVAVLRLGVVLDARGGAVAKMLPIFRLGIGGPLGNGKQWMSWIAMPDLLDVIVLALERESIEGPMNAVAPEPVRNRDFAGALGLVLGRPAWIPAPAPALKLLFGEMADEALLSSARVEPARLAALGHDFRFRDIEGALRHAVKASEKAT